MKDMDIQSTYNVGDKVWAYRQEDGKFYEGTINDVQSWDKWNGFRYEILHQCEEYETGMTITAEERFVYTSREDITTKCFVPETKKS